MGDGRVGARRDGRFSSCGERPPRASRRPQRGVSPVRFTSGGTKLLLRKTKTAGSLAPPAVFLTHELRRFTGGRHRRVHHRRREIRLHHHRGSHHRHRALRRRHESPQPNRAQSHVHPRSRVRRRSLGRQSRVHNRSRVHSPTRVHNPNRRGPNHPNPTGVPSRTTDRRR